MHVDMGDRIFIPGHRGGKVVRDCEVVEVRNADGSPPSVVRPAVVAVTTGP